MKSWGFTVWSEVLTIKNGKNQKKVTDPDGKYPIYGSGGLMGYANDYLCDENTTIIGRKGSINKPIYIEEKFWNVDTAFGLCAGPNLDSKFLYYFCRTYNFLKHNKATTLPSLTKADLLQIKIPLPPLAEQKQIAAILDAADSLRQKDQQLVEHYTALSQSLFLEMFGDDSQFPSISAGDVIDIRDGTHDSPKYVDEGFPLITSKNIKNGDLDFSSVNFISQADYDQIQKRSAASVGDIIMPMIGTIGNPHLITKQPNYAIKNVALFKFHESDQVKNVFIYSLLNSQYFERYVASKNKGGTQKFISLGDLRKMPILVPPITLQNQFAERIAIIEQQKQQAQTNLQKSEALFNSLLQRAFTGGLTADKAA